MSGSSEKILDREGLMISDLGQSGSKYGFAELS